MPTLMEYYRSNICFNQELSEALKDAGNCFWDKNSKSEEVLSGYFTLGNQYWPIDLSEYDLAVEWMDAFGIHYGRLDPHMKKGRFDWIADESDEDREAFAKVRRAEVLLRAAFDKMMAPIKNGSIKTQANSAGGSGVPTTLSPAIWARPLTRIDFINGEILRVESVRVSTPEGWDPRTARRQEKLEREWTGVMVGAASEARESVAAERPMGKGGRPLKHPWAAAYDRMIVKILDDGAYPKTADELASLLLDCLQDAGSTMEDAKDLKKVLKNDFPLLYERSLHQRVVRLKKPRQGGETG